MPPKTRPSDEGETVIAVTGANGAIGRRVVAALEPVGRVVAIDVAAGDLKRSLDGVDVVVHLAFDVGTEGEAQQLAARNIDVAARVLDAAGDAGIRQLVLNSSAAVYGAWPNNPVPLTEDAPVRPNPGFGFALQKAELERLAGEWADDHPGAALTILRPAVPLDEEHAGFLSQVLGVRAPIAVGDADVEVQFVHADDVASAVAHVVQRELDGVFNVAADGWLTAGAARSLAGPPPRVRLPERFLRAVARVGRTPVSALPYTQHPWVVAADRLKATGWSPRVSNEEAIVATTEGMPWSRITPKRRQELALVGSVAAIVLAAVGAVALARRIRRRRG